MNEQRIAKRESRLEANHMDKLDAEGFEWKARKQCGSTFMQAGGFPSIPYPFSAQPKQIESFCPVPKPLELSILVASKMLKLR